MCSSFSTGRVPQQAFVAVHPARASRARPTTSTATGWTPCIGVTLGAVLSASALTGTTLTGFLQIVAYCVGLGVPFLVIALVLDRALPFLRALARHRRTIDLGSAGVLAAMGVLLMTNNLIWVTQRLTDLLPRELLSPLGR
jgi:cytochrome c-type biogenesis protein